jgi:2-polyprenyl-3-methyl-5-hydroxy-6-metoxy-1,4-benzoquinol methylase
MLTNVQYEILKRFSPRSPERCAGRVYERKSKLAILMGDKLLIKISGKIIVDFGCGDGVETVEMAQKGASG